MNTKLTLTIEKEIIEKAKEFAKQQNRSLSDIVENYLMSITKNKVENKDEELPPITKSLKGIFKDAAGLDYDNARNEWIQNKYLK